MSPHNRGFAWHGWRVVQSETMSSASWAPGRRPNSVPESLWRLAGEYSFLIGETSRMSARAHHLHLIERADLPRPMRITTRRVMAWELRRRHRLAGAIRLQLDLAFRASFTPAEVLAVAERGIVRVAVHPNLGGYPIGVALAMPSDQLPDSRAALLGQASGRPPDLMVPFAIATNPTGLGAGAALIRDIGNDCDELPSRPRMVAFAPLTGMRARVIQTADDPRSPANLREQLRFLLRSAAQPATIPSSVESWLQDQADSYAASTRFMAGNFHRATGAELIGIAASADPDDCDAMWMRAHFAYSNG